MYPQKITTIERPKDCPFSRQTAIARWVKDLQYLKDNSRGEHTVLEISVRTKSPEASVLTTLQRMHEKGIVEKRAMARNIVYWRFKLPSPDPLFKERVYKKKKGGKPLDEDEDDVKPIDPFLDKKLGRKRWEAYEKYLANGQNEDRAKLLAIRDFPDLKP